MKKKIAYALIAVLVAYLVWYFFLKGDDVPQVDNGQPASDGQPPKFIIPQSCRLEKTKREGMRGNSDYERLVCD